MAKNQPVKKKEENKDDLPILLLFGVGLSGLFFWLSRRKPGPANLSGLVTDFVTGDPVPGASVTLDGMSTTTDIEGFYSFIGLTPGNFIGTCSAAGYQTTDFGGTLIAGNNTINIVLVPEPVQAARATLNGTLLDDAQLPTECYFEWGATPTLGSLTSRQEVAYGAPFSYPLSALARGTTYYFQAVAINDAGEARGEILSFTTP